MYAMDRDMAAFRAKLSAGAAHYEMREQAPDWSKINETIAKLGSAFDEYKKVNDARLDEVKKGGVAPETQEKLAKLDKEIDQLSDLKKRLETVETRQARPGASDGERKGETQAQREHREAFFNWFRNPADRDRESRLRDVVKALETRAVQTTSLTGAAGGFALPEQIERTIARLSVDISPMRQIATVRTVGTPDYKELFDVNGAAFEWVGETGTRSQTNTPDLAEVAPTFGMASARPRASEESLDDLFFDVEGWLQSSVAETLAAGEGAAFISGNGTNRPTGLLSGPAPVTTADSGRAFGTLQYIIGGQAAAMPTSPDVFVDMVYGLRARYRQNARWLTSKMTLAALRKYKDTTNQYLWQPSLSQNQPEMFMGYPITEAEDMPAVAANAFPLAFGDFREGYLICDRVGMRVTRDDITLPGFVQWYVRRRVGGRLRNTQAIKLLRIATT
jgi:HK97 family phage major capsid protein